MTRLTWILKLIAQVNRVAAILLFKVRVDQGARIIRLLQAFCPIKTCKVMILARRKRNGKTFSLDASLKLTTNLKII